MHGRPPRRARVGTRPPPPPKKYECGKPFLIFIRGLFLYVVGLFNKGGARAFLSLCRVLFTIWRRAFVLVMRVLFYGLAPLAKISAGLVHDSVGYSISS